MSDQDNKNYLQVGYNNLLQITDSLSFVLGENIQDNLGTGTEISSESAGSVETMSVKSQGGIGDLWITNFIKSKNWQPKSIGFYIDGQTGYSEFSNVYVSGGINAVTGTIGGFTIGATTLSAASGGNTTILSSGATAFSAGPTGSPTATITQAGVATFKSVILNTSVQISNIVTGSEISIQGWVHTMVFSVTDADTVSWSSGSIKLMDGTTYSISAGNTGNMSAETYVYLDIATSLTVLQVTTTKINAVGTGKILICVAQNGTAEATFVVFGSKELNIPGTSIVANSITSNEIYSGYIYAGTINVNQLTAGTITSKTISLAISAGTGDVYIAAGKTDFGQDATAGFILGLDDSDSDKAKFEIGSSATKILKYDGTDFTLIGGTITGGVVQTATTGNRIKMNGSNNHLEFLDNSTIYGYIYVYVNPTYNGIIMETSATGGSFLAISEGTNNYIEMYTGDSGITIDENLGLIILSTTIDTAHVQPGSNATYDIGTNALKYKDAYFSGNIVVGGTVDGVDISGNINQAVLTTSTPTFRGITISSGYYLNTSTNTPTVNGDLIPYSNNYNDLGLSTQYWYRLYANHVYYKDHQAFDAFDDISLMKNIKMKTVTRERNNKTEKNIEETVDIWDETTMPAQTMENGFFKAGAVNGLLIGAIKELIKKIELFEERIKKIEKVV